MSDISKIILPDGNQYDLKDSVARTEVTTTSSGLMSAIDKVKLNLIEDNAQKNIIESISVNGNEIEVIDKNVDIKVPNITEVCDEKTVSGNLIHIEDAVASSANIKTNFSPIQDFNGYDHPWIGGVGKNLSDPKKYVYGTTYGITRTDNGGGVVGVSGTATGSTTRVIGLSGADNEHSVLLKAGITYFINGCWSGITPSTSTLRLDVRPTDAGGTVLFHENNTEGYTPAEDVYVRINLRIAAGYAVPNNVSCAPILTAGERAKTFELYENICPISGYTGVTVTRTGKNLIDDNKRVSNSSMTTLTIGQTVGHGTPTIFLKAGTYTASVTFKNGATGAGNIRATDPNIGNKRIWEIGSTSGSFTLIQDANVAFYVSNPDGISTDDVATAQVEVGSTATEYEPYNSATYTVTFPTEAGTVYGGTLNVYDDGSGTLTVDRGCFTSEEFASHAKGGSTINDEFFFRPTTGQKPLVTSLRNDDLLCSHAPLSNTSAAVAYAVCRMGSGQPRIVFPVGTMPTLSAFNEWLAAQDTAGKPFQFSYILANPKIYALSAVQVVQMLEGINNVWTDTNNNIDLTYKTRFTIITPEERNKLNNIPASAAPNYFGVCSDSGVTRTITVDNSFTLAEGVMINVFFENASASQATLNVNNTGAYPIYIYGTQPVSNTIAWGWRDNQLVELIFHDSKWWVQNQYFNNAGTTSAGLMTAAHVTKLNSLDPNSTTPIQLTNEDLNDIHPLITTWYYADGANTCAHKPTGTTVTAFGMLCIRTANTYVLQIVFPHTTNRTFTRYYTGSSWSAWRDQSITYDAASGWPGLMSAADKVKLDGLKASTLNVTDTYGVAGTAGATVTIQALMDAIASKV